MSLNIFPKFKLKTLGTIKLGFNKVSPGILDIDSVRTMSFEWSRAVAASFAQDPMRDLLFSDPIQKLRAWFARGGPTKRARHIAMLTEESSR
jgi:hypothetical protein